MSGQLARKEQFTLRVRRGSEVDLLLQGLTDGNFHTNEDASEIGGLVRSWIVARRWLPEWFDNASVTTSKSGAFRVNYTEVRPTVVQSIDNAEFNVTRSGDVAVGEDVDVAELVWPDAPPLIQKMDAFRKPSHYDNMKAMVEAGKHIALAGPPGIGKSTSVEQLAAEQGIPLVNVSADAGLRRRDLVGTPEMVNGTTKFLVAEYAAAVVNGWWVKIDEVNAADADAIMFVNSQLAAPFVINIHGKQYPVHPNFRLFVTYNPGLIGTKPLPPAFKDRFFPVKLEFPSASQLKRMLEANGLPADAAYADKLVEYGCAVWEAHKRGRIRYQISPRRLMDAVLLMNTREGVNIKDAVADAVIAALDSPVEEKVLLELSNAVFVS